MLLFPSQTRSVAFLLFTLFINLTFLVPFGGNKYALAQYLGPDNRYPPPPDKAWTLTTSDYPRYEDLQANFYGTGPDQTLLNTLQGGYLLNYRALCGRPGLNLKCIDNAFSPGYVLRNGRTQRWYRDFFYRLNRYYMEKAINYVYVLTQLAADPISCAYFYDTISPVLRFNPQVTRIYLVDPEDWATKRVYWDRADAESGSGGNRDGGITPNPAAPALVLPLIGTGATSFSTGLAALDGFVNGIKSKVPPDWRIFFGDEKKQDPAEKTDVLPLHTTLLPSSDDQAGTKGGLLVASADGTSEPQTGEVSSTSGTSTSTNENTDLQSKTIDQTTGNEIPDFRTFMQRRRLSLLPRDSDICMGWVIDMDSLSNPIQPGAAGTSSDSNIKLSVTQDSVLSPLGFKPDTATVVVTQHDRLPEENYYVLDILIYSDPQGKPIQDEQGVKANPDEEIKIDVPWKANDPPPTSPLTLATFTWPLSLYVDGDREKPIRFEYGGLLMFGSGTGGSGNFDSNDQRHCSTSPWSSTSTRTIRCTIAVEHYSLPQINVP